MSEFIPLTVLQEYDWEQAFLYANPTTNLKLDGIPLVATDPFTTDDVAEIIAKSEGENDGPSWLMLGRLRDSRFFVLEAGCDYTGWDCQASGSSIVASSPDLLIRYGMSRGDRERLGLSLPEDDLAGAEGSESQ